MAQVPDEKQVRKNLEQSDRAVKRKLELQKAQGKDFVNHGQGVMPEAVWKSLPGRKLEDPEAVK